MCFHLDDSYMVVGQNIIQKKQLERKREQNLQSLGVLFLSHGHIYVLTLKRFPLFDMSPWCRFNTRQGLARICVDLMIVFFLKGTGCCASW